MRITTRIILFGIPLLFLLIFFCYPLASILRLGLTPQVWVELLGDPYYQRVVWFSVWQAVLSTLLTLLVGLPAAFVFARFEFRLRRFLRVITLVPFVLPTVVVAAGFVAFLGPHSVVSDVIALVGLPQVPLIGTLGAVVLAHVFYNLGLVVRLVGGLWAGIDTRLEQAAATLGAKPLAVFWHVTLPLLLPGIAAAALLTFIFTFGSFGIVLLLGGPRMATVEVEVYRQTTQNLNLDVAAGLALLQALITIIAGVFYSRLERTVGRANLWAQPAQRRMPQTLAEHCLLVSVIVGVLLLLAPLAALAWRSITLPAAPGLPAVITLDYFRMLSENRRGSLFFVPPIQAIANSLGFATIATIITLMVGIPAAYLVSGGTSQPRPQGTNTQPTTNSQQFKLIRRWLDLLFTLPIGVSAVMLGLGSIVAWGPLGILTSPLLIPIAHALLAFPFVVRTLAPALQGINPRLREAARMLGAGSLRVLLAVELRLIAPALTSGALFAFTVSLGDYGAALLLSRPDFPTIPVVIARFLGQPGAANYGQALALSTILMLISIGAFLLIEQRNAS